MVTTMISITKSTAVKAVAINNCLREGRNFIFPSESAQPKATNGKPIKNIRRILKNHPLSNSVLKTGSQLPIP